jgi:hypothetical protein
VFDPAELASLQTMPTGPGGGARVAVLNLPGVRLCEATSPSGRPVTVLRA